MAITLTIDGQNITISDKEAKIIDGLEFVGNGYSISEANSLNQGSWNEKNIKNFLILLGRIKALEESQTPQALPTLPPVGSIIAFAGNTEPNGFLFCRGQWLLKSEEPTLYSALGDIYGVSALSFRVPDLRGNFIRGFVADKTGVDDGRVYGSFQNGIGSHTHGVITTSASVTTASSGGVSCLTSVSTKSGYSSSVAPANLALNYIIRAR